MSAPHHRRTDPNAGVHPGGVKPGELNKREHFAALALQGILARVGVEGGADEALELADAAVLYADCLVTALNEAASREWDEYQRELGNEP